MILEATQPEHKHSVTLLSLLLLVVIRVVNPLHKGFAVVGFVRQSKLQNAKMQCVGIVIVSGLRLYISLQKD